MFDYSSSTFRELHQAAVEVGRNHARSEYELIRCLVWVERRGLHRRMQCSTAVNYAVRFLDLHPHKASEMLRVGRVLHRMLEVDRAYR